MPTIKKYRGKKKMPRRGRKKGLKKRQGAVSTIVRQPGFTDTCFVKLKYAEEIRMHNGASSNMIQVFRGNSIYDPNATGVGHQPMYFDQYSVVYEHYRVYAAKIKVQAMNYSIVTTSLILQTGTDQTILSDISALLEQSKAHQSRILPVSGRFPSTISQYCTTRKACGLSKAQAADRDYAALTTANPAQLWYFNLLASNQDNLTPVDVFAIFQVTYYVQFYDRKISDQS